MSDAEITGPFHITTASDTYRVTGIILAHATSRIGALWACAELLEIRPGIELRVLDEDYDHRFSVTDVTTSALNHEQAQETGDRFKQTANDLATLMNRFEHLTAVSGFLTDDAYAHAIESAKEQARKVSHRLAYAPLSLYSITKNGKAWMSDGGAGENDGAL